MSVPLVSLVSGLDIAIGQRSQIACQQLSMIDFANVC